MGIHILKVGVALLCIALCSCAAQVPLPPVGVLPEPKQDQPIPALPPAKGSGMGADASLIRVKTEKYTAGQREDLSVTFYQALGKAFVFYQNGEPDKTLDELSRRDLGSDPETRWLANSLRFDALSRLGRVADAERLAEDLAPLDMQITQSNLSTRAMRGLARMQMADFDGALADLGQVAAALGAWSLPVSLGSIPSNLLQLRMFSEAQLRAYTGIAVVYARREDYAKALAWAEAAENLYRDLYQVLSHPLLGDAVPFEVAVGRAFNLATLGLSRTMVRPGAPAGMEQLAVADLFFAIHKQALGQVVVQAYRTQAAMQAGHIEESLKLALEGEAIAARAGMGDVVWLFAMERGEAELKLGHRDKAEAAFRSAQNGVEQASGALSSEAARLRFGVGKERILQRLVEFGLARNDLSTLFRDLERGRAMAFVDLLSGLPLVQGRQANLVASIRDLDQRILLQRLKSGTAEAAAEGTQLEARLVAERSLLATALRQRDPELADTLSVSSVDLETVSNRLRPGEALAYVLPGKPDEAVALLVSERSGSRIVRTAASEQEFAQLLWKLREAIVARDAGAYGKLSRDVAAKLKLAEWGVKIGLYVVPRGGLYFVPWGALELDYPVAVLPLGGWLARDPVKVRVTRPAAVAGDPEFNGVFPQLPAARKEAEEVGMIYGVPSLSGNAATEDALRREVGAGVGVLHLATHGFFRAERPLSSGVVLSGKNKPEFLTASRLVESPLPAKLVVLSACETGLASATAGDDFLGLPRSFYLGGALAVVSSLWPVDDDGTQMFMRTFHERARNGDYGGGWLAARDKLKAAGAPPFVYGAFVLGGALHE